MERTRARVRLRYFAVRHGLSRGSQRLSGQTNGPCLRTVSRGEGGEWKVGATAAHAVHPESGLGTEKRCQP
mgnify:CR=1 FL=1